MNLKGFYAYQPHQGKERAYLEALRDAKWFKANYHKAPIKFALYSLDSGKGGIGWSEAVEDYNARGIPLFLYPHAARPMVQYDGIIEVNPGVRCLFTHAEGGKQVMEAFGFEKPVEVVGWSFCKIKPFRPVEQVKNVLFAPIHPNFNGWLSKYDLEINQKAFKKIHTWCKKSGANLTVRHLHALSENGLEPVEGVTFFRGSADQSTADIENADLVVAHQTFAYLAVARGKPTLMMGEAVPPRSGNNRHNFKFVKHWIDYKDLLMFPLDILNCRSVDKLIEKAASGDAEIAEWRRFFIGDPFDGQRFVDRLESYL